MPDDRPLKALLVEDESLLALDIETMLEEMGCKMVASVHARTRLDVGNYPLLLRRADAKKLYRPNPFLTSDVLGKNGFGPTRSLRALWGLRELGAEFEFEVVNLLAGAHQRPEYLRLNPAGKLPVLVDGDLVIPESATIVLYLAEKYPQSRLLPADLKARAQVYRWVMFAMTELEQPLWRLTRHTALLPEDRRLPQDAALAREDFTRMASVLEHHMAGRAFIVGPAGVSQAHV